ncbi:MAG: beta-eliminating lyase-related protein [Lachnospiraceae bacterium]|nr:beta-eliminating lyase-related protein [Lachnospiraceae bacterium]
MLSFVNDYSEVAHSNILNRLFDIQYDKQSGYGTDTICDSAKEKIRTACDCPDADIYFLVGGTQTNQIVIDTMTAPYEGVLAAETGHVASHEAGAIEFSGHKVLTLPHHDGKIDAGELADWVETFYADGNHEHMVFPGMVYISHPTEFGTLYSKDELVALRKVCDEFKLPLYLDGARLGYGVACEESDVTLKDVAALTDVFYIGGTKVGAMFGEAVVFTHHNAPKYFVTQMKQHGGLLAKGFMLGVQFDELFTDDLYLKISKNALDTAKKIKNVLKEKNYQFLIDSPTNQTFVVMDNEKLAELEKKVNVAFWEKYDDTHTAIRICTSWATKMEDVEKLIKIL